MHQPLRIVRVGDRQVGVEDAGPEGGFPVIVHHGGTRHLFPGAVRDAQAAGLRLIGYDRPGQGASTPQPGRVVFFEEPERARTDFRAQAAEFAPLGSSPAWWLERWGDRAGRDAAHGREWAVYLALVNRDGYAAGDEGWWEDWSASFLPWGFDPGTIKAPVALWHGLADTAAPAAHSRWLADHIPHVTARFPAGEDHTNVEENNRAAAIAWVRAHI